MPRLTNAPRTPFTFELERRKSYGFQLNLLNGDNTVVDLTGVELRFIVKETPWDDDQYDSTNMIYNRAAEIGDPETGIGTFNFQASELDWDPGQYYYAIVFLSLDGFSGVVLKGSFILLENTESDSMHRTYSVGSTQAVIEAKLRGGDVLSVITNNIARGAQGVQGEKGDPGEPGEPGADSTVPGPPGPANTLVIGNVTTGEVADAHITGEAPLQVLDLVLPQGPQGTPGSDGAPGNPGSDGSSAYELAVAHGFVGDEAAWLASLVGAPGTDGTDGAPGSDGAPGADGADGAPGADGADGLSAYEVAVANGFVGTEAAWLASLVGADGDPGADGTDGTDGVDGVSPAPNIWTGSLTAAQSLPAATWTDLKVNGSVVDGAQIVDGTFTAVKDGVYTFDAGMDWRSFSNPHYRRIRLLKSDGTVLSQMGIELTGYVSQAISATTHLTAGQNVKFQAIPSESAGITTSLSDTAARMQVSGPDGTGVYSNDGLNAPKRAKMTKTATQTLTANTWAKITFDTINYDSGYSASLANGEFTAPDDGYYDIHWMVRWQNFGSAYRRHAAIVLGTSEPTNDGGNCITAAMSNMASWWNVPLYAPDVWLNAGDKVTFWALSGVGTSFNNTTSPPIPPPSYVQIRKTLA